MNFALASVAGARKQFIVAEDSIPSAVAGLDIEAADSLAVAVRIVVDSLSTAADMPVLVDKMVLLPPLACCPSTALAVKSRP